MHQFHCTQCGFRVITPSDEEAVYVARRHMEEQHNESMSLEAAAEALEQVNVTEDTDEDDWDDLGPVRTDGKADEW